MRLAVSFISLVSCVSPNILQILIQQHVNHHTLYL